MFNFGIILPTGTRRIGRSIIIRRTQCIVNCNKSAPTTPCHIHRRAINNIGNSPCRDVAPSGRTHKTDEIPPSVFQYTLSTCGWSNGRESTAGAAAQLDILTGKLSIKCDQARYLWCGLCRLTAHRRNNETSHSANWRQIILSKCRSTMFAWSVCSSSLLRYKYIYEGHAGLLLLLMSPILVSLIDSTFHL